MVSELVTIERNPLCPSVYFRCISSCLQVILGRAKDQKIQMLERELEKCRGELEEVFSSSQVANEEQGSDGLDMVIGENGSTMDVFHGSQSQSQSMEGHIDTVGVCVCVCVCVCVLGRRKYMHIAYSIHSTYNTRTTHSTGTTHTADTMLKILQTPTLQHLVIHVEWAATRRCGILSLQSDDVTDCSMPIVLVLQIIPHIYIHMLIEYNYAYVCAWVLMSNIIAHMYAYTKYTYTHTHKHTHACTHIRTHAHTHTHIHTIELLCCSLLTAILAGLQPKASNKDKKDKKKKRDSKDKKGSLSRIFGSKVKTSDSGGQCS